MFFEAVVFGWGVCLLHVADDVLETLVAEPFSCTFRPYAATPASSLDDKLVAQPPVHRAVDEAAIPPIRRSAPH